MVPRGSRAGVENAETVFFLPDRHLPSCPLVIIVGLRRILVYCRTICDKCPSFGQIQASVGTAPLRSKQLQDQVHRLHDEAIQRWATQQLDLRRKYHSERQSKKLSRTQLDEHLENMVCPVKSRSTGTACNMSSKRAPAQRGQQVASKEMCFSCALGLWVPQASQTLW